MFLHLGSNCLVKKDDIIGIFDLDTATVTKTSRDFLKKAEESGDIINVSVHLPKSFILCKSSDKKSGRIIYISQIGTGTIEKRAKNTY